MCALRAFPGLEGNTFSGFQLFSPHFPPSMGLLPSFPRHALRAHLLLGFPLPNKTRTFPVVYNTSFIKYSMNINNATPMNYVFKVGGVTGLIRSWRRLSRPSPIGIVTTTPGGGTPSPAASCR